MPGYLIIPPYTAVGVPMTPTGDIAATNVQDAMTEIASEKATTNSVSSVSASVQASSTKVLDVYSSASARSSALPSPTEGKLTYLTDQKTIQVYNGTAWVAVSGESGNLIFLAGT